jgi:hypothetical protein
LTTITFTEDDIPDPERVAQWRDEIAALRDIAGKKLSAWERQFLDSIESYLDERGILTPKQAATLASVHAKHLGDGA